MTGSPADRRPRVLQRGASLWVVVMMTLLASLLGMGLSSSVIAQFRGVRNERDLALARQAGEAALRDAEADAVCQQWNAVSGVMQQAVAPTISRAHCLSLVPTCAQLMPTRDGAGLRLLGRSPATTPAAIDWGQSSCTTGACGIVFGSVTGAPALAGVAQAPRYHIEVLDVAQSGDASAVPLFRISVRAWGGSTGTYVDLQEVFRPCR